MTTERAMAVSGTEKENFPSRAKLPGLRNKTMNLPAIRSGQDGAADYVPHLSRGDVQLMAVVAGRDPRHGRRNTALIRVIFDGALRISEALGIRRADIEKTPDGWLVHINGKTGAGVAAISSGTVNELLAYWGDESMARDIPIFGITRSTAYRIVVSAYQKAGVRRPSVITDRVGAVHVLRHSGALERLRLTGNPRALQHQLRHKSAAMTLKYLKTQQADESMVIQQHVEVW
jgi:integrase